MGREGHRDGAGHAVETEQSQELLLMPNMLAGRIAPHAISYWSVSNCVSTHALTLKSSAVHFNNSVVKDIKYLLEHGVYKPMNGVTNGACFSPCHFAEPKHLATG